MGRGKGARTEGLDCVGDGVELGGGDVGGEDGGRHGCGCCGCFAACAGGGGLVVVVWVVTSVRGGKN